MDGQWLTEATLNVPVQADFIDYSDRALFDDGDGSFTAAVVSQESSAIWIGTLTTGPWNLAGPGIVYGFPRTGLDDVQYCSIEGVSFLNRTTLAMVSDKTDIKGPCSDKEESVHIFSLP